MRNDFFFLEDDLSQIEQFLKFNYSSILHYRDTFEQRLVERSKSLSKDEKDDLMSNYVDIISDMHFAFPSLFFSNFVVLWFSFIGTNLLKICKKLDLIEQENLRGGIDEARKLLSRGAKYKFAESTWNEIKLIQKMRNDIVHKYGCIQYKYSKQQKGNKYVPLKALGDTIYIKIEPNYFKYLEKYRLYDVFEYFYINPNYEYCVYLTTFAKELFEDLDKKLPYKTAKAG